MFCELIPIKEPQQNYKIKKLMCKATGKCPIKTLGFEFVPSNCTREIGIDNFGCLNRSYIISIL